MSAFTIVIVIAVILIIWYLKTTGLRSPSVNENTSNPRPTVIKTSLSPNGNIEAFVDQESHVAFLYLRGRENANFGMQACWVRNLVPAPEKLDIRAVRRGKTPCLPRDFCRHPDGAPPLNPEHIEIIWNEAGDGAFLLEQGELLVEMPSWSGLMEEFVGYSRDCTGRGPFCWEMPQSESNEVLIRLEKARKFWESWRDDESPWAKIQSGLMQTYEEGIGSYEKVFSVDEGSWPPREILRIPIKGGVVMVSIGMSIRAQPRVFTEEPEKLQRIETGVCIADCFPESVINGFSQSLASVVNFPWKQYTWLGHGHTITYDVGIEDPNGEPFSAFLVMENPPGSPDIHLPEYRGNPVNLLWLVPITQGELNAAMEKGSEVVMEKLTASGTEWMHKPRSSLFPLENE